MGMVRDFLEWNFVIYVLVCAYICFGGFFKNKFIYFIYLFLAALGLRCWARAFSSCGDQGLLFIAVRRLLIMVASLVRSMHSGCAAFRSCSMQSQ